MHSGTPGFKHSKKLFIGLLILSIVFGVMQCLRSSTNIIFHILYIIVAPLCSTFLKHNDFHKALLLRSEVCSDWLCCDDIRGLLSPNHLWEKKKKSIPYPVGQPLLGESLPFLLTCRFTTWSRKCLKICFSFSPELLCKMTWQLIQ